MLTELRDDVLIEEDEVEIELWLELVPPASTCDSVKIEYSKLVDVGQTVLL